MRHYPEMRNVTIFGRDALFCGRFRSLALEVFADGLSLYLLPKQHGGNVRSSEASTISLALRWDVLFHCLYCRALPDFLQLQRLGRDLL